MAVAVAVAVVASAATAYHFVTKSETMSMCAELPDAIGVYEGNPVTVLGVEVGSVTSLTPTGHGVRVGMDIGERSLAAGVGAVSINNSVLSDRRIELVGADRGEGAEFDVGHCIPIDRTATPVTINRALDSVKRIMDDIAAGDDESRQPIQELLDMAVQETGGGTGDSVNQLLRNANGLLADPKSLTAQIGMILNNFAVLSQVSKENWDKIGVLGRDMADVLAWGASMFDALSISVATIAEGFDELNDLLGDYLPQLLDVVDDNRPLLDLTVSQLGALGSALTVLPGLASRLKASLDPGLHALRVVYRTSAVRIESATAGVLCDLSGPPESRPCQIDEQGKTVVNLSALMASQLQGGR
ncbi:MCE family protein [Nocardia uniformis]|uniref:MCE family protein n=2 Tax=Nocardia uniformis TaxID=53432 RepID=A0A849BWE1_9NOCA|nr:MlaD family protein [Nocardia uniformis]NNH70882.1 MCE family protein [Nocardia uniformis]